MTPATEKVLTSLRANTEGTDYEGDGWFSVYLDNARPTDMAPRTFAAHLSILEQAGLYRRLDGYAWGEVRVDERAASEGWI
jgi:hypothetical protein